MAGRQDGVDRASAGLGKRGQGGRGEIEVVDLTGVADSNGEVDGSGLGTRSAGSKRPRTPFEPNKANLKANSRATYDTNKGEIDVWYDEQYSKSLGIPEYGRLKHSTAPWYQKLAAWQKENGHTTSPTKKRRLNDDTTAGSPLSANPRQARLEGDLVAVPEPPFDKLSDFEIMPNGNYACAHVNRRPPLECCRTGLSKHAKREAIKKSKVIWKKQVERLIDTGMLDMAHKEWENWVCMRLREKYQPALFKEQIERKVEREKQRRVDAEEEKGKRDGERGFVRQRVLQQQAVVRPRRRYPASPTEDDDSPPFVSYSPRPPVSTAHRQSMSDDIEAAQASFLASLTRTDPRQLRQYDALYRDAQYREALKEVPDFALLKKWYLAYFLKDKGQLLSAEQQRLLEDGDPSYVGRRRASNRPALATVDSLYSRATEDVARPAESVVTGKVQSALEAGQTVIQMASSPILLADPSTPAVASDLQDASPAPSAAQVMPTPFKLWNPETIDRELDRILASRPMVQGAAVSDSVPQQAPRTRSEASYLSSLPQSFATGNEAVDAEMRNMLQYAYQIEPPPHHSPEAEQLLRQGFEYSRADWQRYCDSYAHEGVGDLQPQAGDVPAVAEEPPVDGFDFGEPLTEEQLAVFDFDDPVGRELFAQHDARVAAAHAANLARCG
ncbi:hypothetical protein M3J07_003938 [Ascochyta lentis]